MVDECVESEEGEGTSRHNTLNFFANIASDQRRQVLGSGDETKAEEALIKGMDKVLAKKPGTRDTLTILRLLMSISTYSGKNATKQTAGDCVKRMMDSVSSNGHRGAREDLIRLFADYVEMKPPLDAREAMREIKKHSDVLADLALSRGDKAAKALIVRLEQWCEEAIDLWTRDRADDYPREKIVTSFCKTLLGDILVGVHTRTTCDDADWHRMWCLLRRTH
jgi:hypothetical protein